MRDAWPAWKAGTLVFVGVFVVYAMMYRDRLPSDRIDFLARGLAAAAIGALVAGALQIVRNRSGARRH
jgi:hypothetical protein